MTSRRDEPRLPHKQVRQVAEWLKSIGFEFLDVDADDHPIYVWPPTRQTVKLPGTPKGHGWVDNTRKAAARIAGVEISSKRDAQAIKEREAAGRARKKESQEARRRRAQREALDKLNAKARAEHRKRLEREVERRRSELAAIESLMRRRPSA
jgi:hypothetical protein